MISQSVLAWVEHVKWHFDPRKITDRSPKIACIGLHEGSTTVRVVKCRRIDLFSQISDLSSLICTALHAQYERTGVPKGIRTPVTTVKVRQIGLSGTYSVTYFLFDNKEVRPSKSGVFHTKPFCKRFVKCYNVHYGWGSQKYGAREPLGEVKTGRATCPVLDQRCIRSFLGLPPAESRRHMVLPTLSW